MTDEFKNRTSWLDSPASDGFAIAPDNGTDLPKSTRGITCGVGGILRVTFVDMADGTYVDIPGRVAGVDYGYRIKRVWATGTTATGLVGFA